MKNKSISYWIWIGVTLVLAIILTSLTQYKFASESSIAINALAAQQTVGLGNVAVYVTAIFSCNIFGIIAVLLGSMLGMVFIGSYGYIIPVFIARLLMVGFIIIYRRKSVFSWKNCIIAAAIAEGIFVLLTFLYELIFLGLEFSIATSGFFAHLIGGVISGIIGLVLLKLFEPKSPEPDPVLDLIAPEDKKKKSGRNLK